MRILIVEDEPWLAEVYAKALSVASYQVQTVDDGQTAIEYIDEALPDLIILDVMLPHGNGIRLLHELRSHVDLKQIPVILCTSLASSIPETAVGAYGVVKILDKSNVRPAGLVKVVKEVLEA